MYLYTAEYKNTGFRNVLFIRLSEMGAKHYLFIENNLFISTFDFEEVER